MSVCVCVLCSRSLSLAARQPDGSVDRLYGAAERAHTHAIAQRTHTHAWVVPVAFGSSSHSPRHFPRSSSLPPPIGAAPLGDAGETVTPVGETVTPIVGAAVTAAPSAAAAVESPVTVVGARTIVASECPVLSVCRVDACVHFRKCDVACVYLYLVCLCGSPCSRATRIFCALHILNWHTQPLGVCMLLLNM